MKILFLDHTAALSGGELALLALAANLDRSRFAPEVILFADGPLVAALRAADVPVSILPLAESVRSVSRGALGVGSVAKVGAVFKTAGFVLRLARHIRDVKPDIIHCNSLKADILGGFAGRLAFSDAKIIWQIHDRIETDYLPAKVVKIFRLLLRRIPHVVIANSHATLETLKLPARCRSAVVYPGIPAADPMRRPGAPGLKETPTTPRLVRHPGEPGFNETDASASLKTNGCRENLEPRSEESFSMTTDHRTRINDVANPQITPISQINEASRPVDPAGPTASAALPKPAAAVPMRRESHCGQSPLVVLVGRISPWKGQDVFINAAAEVLRRFPDCRFQIVGSALFGEDALEAQLKQLAATLGIAEHIAFLGFRKDVQEIIAASTLLVHASTVPEPFGQVIVQAMAAGKPVVATRGGGVLEIVEDEITGLLVPMKDANAMAQAICTILSDPQRAAAMGSAGKERFLAKFTIAQTVEKMQETYAAAAASCEESRIGKLD